MSKTSIIFGRNTSSERRQEITRLLGVTEAHGIDKYLGLPSFVGKSRIQSFSSIKEMVWNQISNWKAKFLSEAGK
jgi:hypothetical protein